MAEALTAPAAGLALDRRLALAITIVLGALLAGLDETRQSFVYGRTAMLSDAILDTIAVSGGALLHHWLTPAPGASALDEPADDASQQGAVEGEHQHLHG